MLSWNRSRIYKALSDSKQFYAAYSDFAEHPYLGCDTSLLQNERQEASALTQQPIPSARDGEAAQASKDSLIYSNAIRLICPFLFQIPCGLHRYSKAFSSLFFVPTIRYPL